jgi:hypothetical protein
MHSGHHQLSGGRDGHQSVGFSESLSVETDILTDLQRFERMVPPPLPAITQGSAEDILNGRMS